MQIDRIDGLITENNRVQRDASKGCELFLKRFRIKQRRRALLRAAIAGAVAATFGLKAPPLGATTAGGGT